MAIFHRKPLNATRFNQAAQKNPALFGIPFALLVVAASFALTPFTQARYNVHVKAVTNEQKIGLDKANRKKFDMREEYFCLNTQSYEQWKPKRSQRPNG